MAINSVEFLKNPHPSLQTKSPSKINFNRVGSVVTLAENAAHIDDTP